MTKVSDLTSIEPAQVSYLILAILTRFLLCSPSFKETLHLFPHAGTTRHDKAGFSLAAEDGLEYSIEGFECWSIHQAPHHDPLYWPQPDGFLLDRWLVPSSDPLHPIKGV